MAIPAYAPVRRGLRLRRAGHGIVMTVRREAERGASGAAAAEGIANRVGSEPHVVGREDRGEASAAGSLDQLTRPQLRFLGPFHAMAYLPSALRY